MGSAPQSLSQDQQNRFWTELCTLHHEAVGTSLKFWLVGVNGSFAID